MVASLPGSHADKIETAGDAPGVMFGKPGLRGALQMLPFGGGQRFKGPLHAVLRTGFHFHKDNRVPFPGHDVDFKASAPPVAGKDAPAHAQKEGRCRVFPCSTRSGRGGSVFCGVFPERQPQHSQPCSGSFFGSTLRKSRRWSGQGP